MKTPIRICLLLGACLSLHVTHSAATEPPAKTDVQSPSTADLLLKQIDEERLAFRLYHALGEAHPGIRQFRNIQRAEQRHFSALVVYAGKHHTTLKAGDLDDPFLFEETQALYDAWLKEGSRDAASALNVGIRLEKVDIADLEVALAASPPERLQAIYKQLLAGSKRHLQAFSRGLERYQPAEG